MFILDKYSLVNNYKMHPIKHFLASFLLSIILAVSFEQNIILWILVGVIAGTLIDVDHLALLIIYGKKMPKFGMLGIDNFNKEFSKYKSFNISKNLSHATIFLSIAFIFIYTRYNLLLPVLASVLLHIALDTLPEAYIKMVMTLKSPVCSSCGVSRKIEAHGNLERSLFVIPLCKRCHRRVHKRKNPYDKKLMKLLSKRPNY